NDPPLAPVAHQSARLRADMLPFLLLALLLAAAISLMQLGLSPHLRPLFHGDLRAVSHHVALLLSLAAASTLLAQFLVVRPQRLQPRALLLAAAVLMAAGLLLMILPGLITFYAGIAVTSFGAAMATPGYQVLLNDRLTTGKGAGVIATSHTLGYGASALLVPVISLWFGEHMLIAAAFITAALFLLLSIGVWRYAAPQEPTV
ncbi:MFS transporter, partial [Cronobacter sakazakii]